MSEVVTEMKVEQEVPDRLMELFDGKEILVTGGTGFMGRVLIEKFLRVVPNVGKIYILCRPKKGKDPKLRVEEMLNCPLFEKVREQRGLAELQKAVVSVSGDVALPDLGLSNEDRKMLCERVNIVYHAAATVRFDELLKTAVLLNTRGTKVMLDLAKEMKRLKLFVYISTAYCQLEQKILKEQFYPPPADPHNILKCVEWMPNDVVEAMTNKILGNYPNSYAFTKALSETLVEEATKHIPAIILRPSIVIPIWRDPLPGWTDNMNGPVGLLIGAGKGVIRTMYCNEDGHADYVPVDLAATAILIATWNNLYHKDPALVYNLTSSNVIKVTWGEMIEIGRKCIEKVPLNGIVWYPGGSMKKSRFLHNICVVLFHMIPAYIIDTILFLTGYKPVMCRVHRRINKGFEVFEYYANNVWEFENGNILKARSLLNAVEAERYYMKEDEVDIQAFFEKCVEGARIYILGEMPDTLPAARRHMRIMYWVDVFTKIIFFVFLIYLLACWSDTFTSLLTNTWSIGTRALSI